jgi:hypothetical protein
VWEGKQGAPLFSLFGRDHITIETVSGRVMVSTQIRDTSGQLVAELIRNQWKVAPPPRTWDRNYSSDTLEVINPEGKIVLQVKALPDRIQLQGEWWNNSVQGLRLSSPVKNGGGHFILFGTTYRPEQAKDAEIKPIFKYPSDLHFGEKLD